MVHVDPLAVGPQRVLPAVKSKFELLFDLASNPGKELWFLKRRHAIMEDMIVIRPPPQYIEHMAELWGVKPNPRQMPQSLF